MGHKSSSLGNEVSVYLNPNFGPHGYAALQTLAVLYDRVYVWSPVAGLLEDNGIPAGEFLAACEPNQEGGPAFVPVCRDYWLDKTERKKHPHAPYRSWQDSFDAVVARVVAEQSARAAAGRRLVLNGDDLRRGNLIADQVWQTSHDDVMRAYAEPDSLPDRTRETAPYVASKLDRPLHWAYLNETAQDVLACMEFRGPSPILMPEQLAQYSLFVDRNPRFPGRDRGFAERFQATTTRIREAHELPELPEGVGLAALDEFVSFLRGPGPMSWNRLRRLRALRGPIREWLRENFGSAHTVTSAGMLERAKTTLSDHRAAIAKQVQRAPVAIASLAGVAFATAPPLVVGPGLAAAFAWWAAHRWETKVRADLHQFLHPTTAWMLETTLAHGTAPQGTKS